MVSVFFYLIAAVMVGAAVVVVTSRNVVRAALALIVVFAGVEYGNGSSRDWAAKGTNLLGVKAVIAQSFERIHRSNLVGMGVIPFTFPEGTSWQSLGLKGDETVTLTGLKDLRPRKMIDAKIQRADGTSFTTPLLCRIAAAIFFATSTRSVFRLML